MRERIRLGQSPLETVPLGAGCWAWGDRRFWHYGETYGPRDVVDAFSVYAAAGLDLFDTAEAYGWGKSEQILGALLRKSGHRAVVATKYAPMAGRGGVEAIHKGLQGSLKRLGLRHIDLYQLHWADREETPIAPTMGAFADAVEQGLVRAIGVSNFSGGEVREAHMALAERGIPLATVQVRYSLLCRAPEVDGVLDTCRELGVTLLAYSPLEQGLLTGKYGGGNRPKDGRAELESFTSRNIAAVTPLFALLNEIARQRGVSMATIALAWLLAQPSVIPLAGAKNGEQAADNVQALGLVLSKPELDELDKASQPWRVPLAA